MSDQDRTGYRNIFLESNLRNMTTRELIKHCEDSDNKLVAELAARLELCLDFAIKQVGL
jgi:hypothetical protein